MVTMNNWRDSTAARQPRQQPRKVWFVGNREPGTKMQQHRPSSNFSCKVELQDAVGQTQVCCSLYYFVPRSQLRDNDVTRQSLRRGVYVLSAVTLASVRRTWLLLGGR